MHKKILLIATFASLLLASCNRPNNQDIRIIATMFPQYSLADELAGDLASVEFILPTGSDPHDFEPTPTQVVSLNQASLIIYTSHSLEPWMESIEETTKADLLELSDAIGLDIDDHDHDDDDHDHDDDDHEEDPHFWVDPAIGLQMLDVIYDQLISLLPEHELLITSRKVSIEESLNEVVELYEGLVEEGEELEIVFAGHNAFAYLETYHIHIQTPYPGFSSSVLPTANSISQFINLMTTLNARYLYVSETDNVAVSQALIEAFPQAETLTIYTLENVSLDKMTNQTRYQELLLMNYEAFAFSGK
jgi:zinc transport system substrate-binding protein